MEKNYFVHPTACVDPGCQVGDGVRIWHFSHLMPGCTVGADCNIGQNVFIASGVVLGKNVKVQNNVSIYEGVVCQDDVFLGPSMVFTNVINPRSAVNRKGEYARTVVGKGATIGANATIVCGNDIGAFAFIGAEAVVTREVAPYSMVIGNPARHRGWMSEFGHKLEFDSNHRAICPESNQEYLLENNRVTKVK